MTMLLCSITTKVADQTYLLINTKVTQYLINLCYINYNYDVFKHCFYIFDFEYDF